MSDKHKCKNCGEEIKANFCANCGQSTQTKRLNFKSIIEDFFSSAFNLESAFFKTFLGLFYAPNKVIEAYISGKRKAYYSPVRYLLLGILIFVFLEYLTGFDPIELSMGEGNVEQKSRQKGYQTTYFILQYINYFTLILPFVFALIVKIFFWKRDFNFAELTAMGCFAAGHYMLINLIPMMLSFADPKLVNLRYLITIAYFAFMIYKVYRTDSAVLTFFKSIFASIFIMISYFAACWFLASFFISFTH